MSTLLPANQRPHTTAIVGIFTLALAAMLGRQTCALDFVLTFDGFDQYPEARTGFQRAAAMWTSVLSDPVTVPIIVRAAPQADLGFSVASCNTHTQDVAYSAVRQALLADATSADDMLAVAHLPPGPTLEFRTKNPLGSIVINRGQQNINTYLDMPKANARALGLSVVPSAKPDAEIYVNRFYLDYDLFDYHRADGVQGLDFVAAISHEIGHALGFTSGVDDVDESSLPNGPNAPDDLNENSIATALDLFRYTAESRPLLDLAPGGQPYLSMDGGATNLAPLASGAFNGDGAQASHWRGGQGLMDPYFDFDEMRLLSAVDRQALDMIGWDLRAAKPGDFDRDSSLTGADVSALLGALADLNAYKMAMGLTDADLLTMGDLDGDGQVTNADGQALLNLLRTGGGSPTAVPEPASVALLAFALPGLALAVVRRPGQ